MTYQMTMTSPHYQTRFVTGGAYLWPARRQLRSHPVRRPAPVLPRPSTVRQRLRSRAARRPVLPTSPRFPSAGLKRIDSSMHRLLAKRTSQPIQPIQPIVAPQHPAFRGHPPAWQHTRRNCSEAWTSHLGAALLQHPPLLRCHPPWGRLGCLPCRTVPVLRRRRDQCRGPSRAPRHVQRVF